jgi:hypothetical protein
MNKEGEGIEIHEPKIMSETILIQMNGAGRMFICATTMKRGVYFRGMEDRVTEGPRTYLSWSGPRRGETNDHGRS